MIKGDIECVVCGATRPAQCETAECGAKWFKPDGSPENDNCTACDKPHTMIFWRK